MFCRWFVAGTQTTVFGTIAAAVHTQGMLSGRDLIDSCEPIFGMLCFVRKSGSETVLTGQAKINRIT